MSKGDKIRFLFVLLAFAVATVMGCDPVEEGNYANKLTVRELPANRIYEVGVRDFEIKTERGWYFSTLHAEPGLLDGTYYNNKSSVSGPKGVSGTLRITVINVPEDAKYVTLKYQYCKSDKCLRSKIQVALEKRIQ